jgi:hypothetical protein
MTLLHMALLAPGCSRDDEAPEPPTAGLPAAALAAAPTRRLSVQELRNSIASITGVSPEAALARLPPDPLDLVYDRVAQSQTVSLLHIEAMDAVAGEVASALLSERRLDELAPACRDEILPPAISAVRTEIPATSLTGVPDWALEVGEDTLHFLYSDDVTVSTTFLVSAAGLYRLTFPIALHNGQEQPDITLSLDGQVLGTWRGARGEQELSVEAELSAGTSLVELSFAPGDPWWSEAALDVRSPSVEGPLDPGEGQLQAERQGCAEALIDALGERAWRRPLGAEERASLRGLWEEALAGGTETDGLRMLIEAVLTSPHFLYLVEVGEPVDGSPGWFRLDDHEQAARLSYALCEQPPDEALRAAAAAGELRTTEQIEAQARRLLDLPCGRQTLARFHRQWLELQGLDTLARDPAYYPGPPEGGFTAALGPALREETEHFLEQMVFEERAGLAATWSARHAWIGPETAWLYGLSVDEPYTYVELPAERAGPLTHPALLAATAKFSETSPVLRGVYVLEQLLCQHLEPPPQELDVTPPPLDETMTTRERWEAHSSDPQCAGCHQLIDPIGFALEEFDALGQHRLTENGQPVEIEGGLPSLGIDELSGGRELSEALAGAPELGRCFAQQWTRFALGRQLGEGEAREALQSIDTEAAASIYEGLVALSRSAEFRHRVISEEEP